MYGKLWLGVIIIILFYLFYTRAFQTAERVVLEQFDSIVPDIEKGQHRFNAFADNINLMNPQIPLSPASQVLVDGALNTPAFGGSDGGYGSASGSSGTFISKGVNNPYKIPITTPGVIQIAQRVCEAVRTPDCAAFQNPEFAANCGISFDPNGINSKGEPHMGGLYISADDRTTQLQQAHTLGLAPADIRYTPTIGESKKGMFTVDANSCSIRSEQIACSSKKLIEGSPNCTQCYTSSEYKRVDPRTPRIPPTFTILTNADSVIVKYPGGTYTVPGLSEKPIPINLPINEGDLIYFDVSGAPGDVYLSGYLGAAVVKGSFIMDMHSLIDIDAVTGYKPRLAGTKMVGAKQCFSMRPAIGKTLMSLRAHIPFSFLSTSEYDAVVGCDNGPVITKKSSADFLGNDVCYGPDNKPGAYSMSCLQQTFIGMGGTVQGTGYPKDAASVNALYSAGGNELAAIANYLYDMNVRASTGRDTAGNSLSIDDWNKASMFSTGTQVTSPCDTSVRDTGPLSKECLQYLYTNSGVGKGIGATYTLGTTYSSDDLEGQAAFCTAGGALSPGKAGGFAKGRSAGGVTAVKNMYNTAHQRANDNTLSNEERAEAIKDCYGTTLRSMK